MRSHRRELVQGQGQISRSIPRLLSTRETHTVFGKSHALSACAVRQLSDPEEVVFQLGHRVAELRRKLDLTQAELAERASVDVRYLQRDEAGELDLRTFSIVRIANALDVLPRQLFYVPRSMVRPKPGRPKPRRAKKS